MLTKRATAGAPMRATRQLGTFHCAAAEVRSIMAARRGRVDQIGPKMRSMSGSSATAENAEKVRAPTSTLTLASVPACIGRPVQPIDVAQRGDIHAAHVIGLCACELPALTFVETDGRRIALQHVQI
jgi:hypothetical protein